MQFSLKSFLLTVAYAAAILAAYRFGHTEAFWDGYEACGQDARRNQVYYANYTMQRDFRKALDQIETRQRLHDDTVPGLFQDLLNKQDFVLSILGQVLREKEKTGAKVPSLTVTAEEWRRVFGD